MDKDIPSISDTMIFLKVMVNDGNVTVDIMKMEASTYAFQYV